MTSPFRLLFAEGTRQLINHTAETIALQHVQVIHGDPDRSDHGKASVGPHKQETTDEEGDTRVDHTQYHPPSAEPLATAASNELIHAQCHDLVCSGDRRAPRGASGVSCSCKGRDTAYADLQADVSCNVSVLHDGEDGAPESTDLFVRGRGISLLVNVPIACACVTYSLVVDGQSRDGGFVGAEEAPVNAHDALVSQREELKEALNELVSIIDKAGLLNLSNGVQLGATSWYVKANDRLDIARAVLAKAGA